MNLSKMFAPRELYARVRLGVEVCVPDAGKLELVMTVPPEYAGYVVRSCAVRIRGESENPADMRFDVVAPGGEETCVDYQPDLPDWSVNLDCDCSAWARGKSAAGEWILRATDLWNMDVALLVEASLWIEAENPHSIVGKEPVRIDTVAWYGIAAMAAREYREAHTKKPAR